MQKILLKMQQNQYESIEDMTADFVQMFDNACKYNEPDSLIYKVHINLLQWARLAHFKVYCADVFKDL